MGERNSETEIEIKVQEDEQKVECKEEIEPKIQRDEQIKGNTNTQTFLSKRLQVISEPRKAAYIHLYSNYRNVLEPDRLLQIKDKISDSLREIEEKDNVSKFEKIQVRKERKHKGLIKRKDNEYSRYCSDRLDEIFHIFSQKLTKSLYSREIPKPLILGPHSMNLYSIIESQLKEIIKPANKDSFECLQKLTYVIMEFVKKLSIEILITKDE